MITTLGLLWCLGLRPDRLASSSHRARRHSTSSKDHGPGSRVLPPRRLRDTTRSPSAPSIRLMEITTTETVLATLLGPRDPSAVQFARLFSVVPVVASRDLCCHSRRAVVAGLAVSATEAACVGLTLTTIRGSGGLPRRRLPQVGGTSRTRLPLTDASRHRRRLLLSGRAPTAVPLRPRHIRRAREKTSHNPNSCRFLSRMSRHTKSCSLSIEAFSTSSKISTSIASKSNIHPLQ